MGVLILVLPLLFYSNIDVNNNEKRSISMVLGILISSISDNPFSVSDIVKLSISGVLAGGLLLEIAPIKFNPISLIFSYLNKSTTDKIDKLQKDIDDNIKNVDSKINKMSEDQDRYRFNNIRWEILEFGNSINNGDLHTAHEYQHIFDDYEEYEELNRKYGFKNGFIEDAIKDIKAHYDESKDSNVKYF
jgi:hypothetical protein